MTEVWFFNDDRKFLAHVQDHFLRPDELWDRLLGGRAFLDQVEGILGGKSGKFLIDPRQKWTPEEVTMLAEVYRMAFPVLADGREFSTTLPLFVRVRTQDTDAQTGKTREEDSFYFLSRWGFIILMRESVLKSAYFPDTSDAQQEHYPDVFHDSWVHLHNKLSRPSYTDRKHQQDKVILEKEWHSAGNWIVPPDPRPKTRAVPTRSFADIDCLRDWLAGCDEVIAAQRRRRS